jgi:group I intron endonuclease
MANMIIPKRGIYKIENTSNRKCYVGSAVIITMRWGHHKKLLRGNKHHSIKLQRAWNKYGETAFTFSILEEVDRKDDLIIREQHWMNILNVISNGYNISPLAGSPLGLKRSTEACAKMSAFHKQRKRGPLSQEIRDKISNALKGIKHGPRSLESIKMGVVNRFARSGYKPSVETRAKMSAAKIEWWKKRTEKQIPKPLRLSVNRLTDCRINSSDV